MPEVHRYQVVTMLSMAGATIGYDPHGPDVVMASDFDNATRLFLDAAERCIASERREKELQQRLTAADERIDERDGTCEWTREEDCGSWNSACGITWTFHDDGPAENGMHFCHSCGKTLVMADEDENDDD